MTKQPDGIFIVADDFNQTDLRSVLPIFYQPPHPHQRKQYPGWCLHKHSWQLQNLHPSPFRSIRPHFPASPVYLLPAD